MTETEVSGNSATRRQKIPVLHLRAAVRLVGDREVRMPASQANVLAYQEEETRRTDDELGLCGRRGKTALTDARAWIAFVFIVRNDGLMACGQDAPEFEQFMARFDAFETSRSWMWENGILGNKCRPGLTCASPSQP